MVKEKLTREDQSNFKDWLDLNLNSISWEGRYLDDFNQVWGMIFEPDVKITHQFMTFSTLSKYLSQGPVIAWFKWLRDKYICYLYVYHALNINELNQLSKIENSQICLILRDYFTQQFPHLEENINETFQIGSLNVIDLNVRFSEIPFLLEIKSELRGSFEQEVLKDLEVTLYNDWENLKNNLLNKKNNAFRIDKVLLEKKKLARQVRFVRELVLLFIVGGVLILAIKVGNKAYEDYLVEKISLFSPKFFWLDKNLSFQNENFLTEKKLDIKLDELERLEQIESKEVFQDIQSAARYEVESDVVLTSVDRLPKDFEAADLEQSDYEEDRKGGYRDSRYGRRRAYRVMMTSVDPEQTKAELAQVLKEFSVEQVDKVKPGTKIPGGIYFNLYVPRYALKKFLSKVSSFEKEATILESRTVYGGKKNMNKVFIWIKSI